MLYFYILFLIILILTVVPLSAVIKRLLKPLLKRKISASKTLFCRTFRGIKLTALTDVYINRVGVFMPNQPIDNDHMEQVLGMVGEMPSRVRKMILRSNAIKTRYYAIDPHTRATTHTSTELAVEAIKHLIAQGMNVHDVTLFSLCHLLPRSNHAGARRDDSRLNSQRASL